MKTRISSVLLVVFALLVIGVAGVCRKKAAARARAAMRRETRVEGEVGSSREDRERELEELLANCTRGIYPPIAKGLSEQTRTQIGLNATDEAPLKALDQEKQADQEPENSDEKNAETKATVETTTAMEVVEEAKASTENSTAASEEQGEKPSGKPIEEEDDREKEQRLIKAKQEVAKELRELKKARRLKVKKESEERQKSEEKREADEPARPAPQARTSAPASAEQTTEAPGIVPSSPGFASAEELGIESSTTHGIAGELLMERDVEVATEAPKRNESEDSTRFWKFTRLPFDVNATSRLENANATTASDDYGDEIDLSANNATTTIQLNATTTSPVSGRTEETTEAMTTTEEAENTTTLLSTDHAILMASSLVFDIENVTAMMGESALSKEKKPQTESEFVAAKRSESGGEERTEEKEESCCELLKALRNKELKKNGTESEFFAGVEGSAEENKLDTNAQPTNAIEAQTAKQPGWLILEATTSAASRSLSPSTGAGLEILRTDKNDSSPLSTIATTVVPKSIEDVATSAIFRGATNAKRSNETRLPLSTTPQSLPRIKWTPYVFDCELEVDERGEALCQEWAKGGLCEINKATRFLFCRRTCLCLGPASPADD